MKKKTAQNETDELRLGWQRTHADFENYKRRVEAEKLNWNARAKAEVIEKILPLLDNLSLAAAHAPRKSDAQNWIDGVVLVEKQIEAALLEIGVSKIAPKPKDKFGHREHEALVSEQLTGFDEGSITKLISPGYKIGSSVIKPAKVAVAGEKNADQKSA